MPDNLFEKFGVDPDAKGKNLFEVMPEKKERGKYVRTENTFEEKRSIVGEIGSSLVAGGASAMEAIGGTMEMLGIPGGEATQEYYQKAGEKPSLQRPNYMQGGTVLEHPERAIDPRWWIRTLGENIPTMATMMIPGGAGLGVARVAGMSALGMKATALGGAFLGSFTAEAGNAYNEAKRALEADGKLDLREIETQATKEGVVVGIVNGLLEAVPFGLLMSRVPGSHKMLKRAVYQTLAEGNTEGLQEVVSIIAAKTGHDPNLVWSEQYGRILESMLAGYGLGGGVGGAMSVKEKIDEGIRVKDLFRKKLKENGATNEEIDLMDETSSDFEKRNWLTDSTLKEDKIYEHAVRKIKAGEEITEEEEAVLELRYFEYVNSGEAVNLTGEATNETMVNAILIAESERETKNEMELIFPKAKAKVKDIIEKTGKYELIQKELDTLTQDKAEISKIVKSKKDMLAVIKEAIKPYLRSITYTEDFKDELTALGKKYITKVKTKGNLDDVANEAGYEDVGDFVSAMNTLDNSLKKAEQSLYESMEDEKVFREKTVFKTQIEELKTKVTAFKAGIRKGTITTKKQIREHQDIFTNIINKSSLVEKDKAKFIKAVKRVSNDPLKLIREVEDFNRKAEKLLNVQDRQETKEKILKEYETPKLSGKKAPYDYESFKLFKELKSYFGLNKEQKFRTLVDMPDQKTESDRIKISLLYWLTSKAKDISPEMSKQVLSDIKNLKAYGKLAKSETEYVNLVNKAEKIEELAEAGKKLKDTKTKATALTNAYVRGVGNIYDYLSTMFGKDFADMYNFEIEESNTRVGVFERNVKQEDFAKELYGEKNIFTLLKRLTESVGSLVGPNGTIELTIDETIDVYNAVKNEKVSKLYNKYYGESSVKYLISQMPERDKAFGDYLMEEVQDYTESNNQRFIEKYGRDMRLREHYWPRTSDKEIEFLDEFKTQSESPYWEKHVAQDVVPIPKSAILKAQRHIALSEHIKNIQRKYEEAVNIFGSSKIKKFITDKYSARVHSDLMEQFDDMALNKKAKKLNLYDKFGNFLLNNWIAAKIGWNPTAVARQASSALLYANNMPAGEFLNEFTKGLLAPKKTFDYMWNNNAWIRERFHRGYSEAVAETLDAADQMNNARRSWIRFQTLPTRVVDVGAIIFGSHAKLKYLKKTMTTDQALLQMQKESLKTQQSPLKSSLARTQKELGPFSRMFMAFKNTPFQYFRAPVNAIINFKQGSISAKQLAKTLFLFNLLQPVMYATMGSLVTAPFKLIGGDEPEELIEDWLVRSMQAIIAQPFAIFPVLDDIATTMIRHATGKKVRNVFSYAMLDDISTAISKLNKEDITPEDWVTFFALMQEPIAGAPTANVKRYIGYLTEGKD